MGPLFESPPRLFLKSGLQPLARYGIHQETTSRRPEQIYIPADTRLEWPEARQEGYYLGQTRMNAQGVLLK